MWASFFFRKGPDKGLIPCTFIFKHKGFCLNVFCIQIITLEQLNKFPCNPSGSVCVFVICQGCRKGEAKGVVSLGVGVPLRHSSLDGYTRDSFQLVCQARALPRVRRGSWGWRLVERKGHYDRKKSRGQASLGDSQFLSLMVPDICE